MQLDKSLLDLLVPVARGVKILQRFGGLVWRSPKSLSVVNVMILSAGVCTAGTMDSESGSVVIQLSPFVYRLAVFCTKMESVWIRVVSSEKPLPFMPGCIAQTSAQISK